ncbi:MAG: hypothetical protein Q8L27_02000 [archaeon]|nr:hypothetical protein [archaeon]
MSYKKYVTAEAALEGTAYVVKNIEDDKQLYDWGDSKLATYDFIIAKLRNLTGEILTVVDASIPSGVQNKCIKDLIRKIFLDEFANLSDLLIEMSEYKTTPESAIVVSDKEILGA